MDNNLCCTDPRQVKIEAIIDLRGPHDGLRSAKDVVAYALKQTAPSCGENAAIDQLYERVIMSRAAELERHLVWRRNLK